MAEEEEASIKHEQRFENDPLLQEKIGPIISANISAEGEIYSHAAQLQGSKRDKEQSRERTRGGRGRHLVVGAVLLPPKTLLSVPKIV